MASLALTRLAGWPLAAALASYLLFATRDWNVPEPGALPFGPLWLAGTAAGLGLRAGLRRPTSPVAAIAIGALVAMALTDVSYLATQGLRDLHLYLRAGERFAAGEPVYLDALFTRRPDDLADYPFLYPPPTLPLFALLAAVPRPIVDILWLVGSGLAAVATLRLFGIGWRWTAALLLWPPFFQGLQVGNVAVPLGLLFALGPWLGAGLVVAAVFKVYSGIAALWLVRERRLGAVAVGLAIVVGCSLLTLPLTGVDRWAEWWRGLELFRDSQPLLADYLYGFGLPRYVPLVVAIGVAGVVVAMAVRARGVTGLARLGLATAVASPSLYAHGLIVALPAFLELRSTALWTVLAITSVAPGIAWWAAIALGVLGWRLPDLRRASDEPWHPLSWRRPWPHAEVVAQDVGRRGRPSPRRQRGARR
jgi:hypothetical protein